MTVTPFRHCVSEIDVRAGVESSRLELLSVSQYRGVVPRSEISEGEPRADDLTNYKRVWPGDIALNRMSAYQGALGISSQEGVVSPDYAVLRSRPEVDARFLSYLMKSQWFVGQMTMRLRGIGAPGVGSVRTPRVNIADLGDVPIALPPLEEQRCTADFLDEQVARIDDMMRLRTSQISLLEQAWHSQRFEVLSQVGAGAPLRRVGSISVIHSGAGFPVEEQGLDIGDLPFIKVADLSLSAPDGTLATAGNFVSSLTARKLGARLTPPGTILFPKVGAALLTNRRALLGIPAVFDNNVMGVRFQVGEPRYFLHAMSCVDLGLLANPGPVPSVNESAVKEIQLAVPQLSSQKAAIRQLDDAMGATASGVGRLNTSLSLLSEYKRSLITAAVTGELDVTTARRGVPA